MVPEEGDEESTVYATERPLDALRIVDVRDHDLRSKPGELAGLGRACIPSDRAHREAALGIGKDRPRQSATLCACCTKDCDDLPFSHSAKPFPRGPPSGSLCGLESGRMSSAELGCRAAPSV